MFQTVYRSVLGLPLEFLDMQRESLQRKETSLLWLPGRDFELSF